MMMTQTLVDKEWQRFALFLAIGGLNTVFGYAAFALFLWIGFANETSVLLGTVAGVAFNFRTIGSVFAARGFSRLPHFIAAYVVLFAANILLFRMMLAAGLGPYPAEAIVVLMIAPVSFLTMRRIVFIPAAEQRP